MLYSVAPGSVDLRELRACGLSQPHRSMKMAVCASWAVEENAYVQGKQKPAPLELLAKIEEVFYPPA